MSDPAPRATGRGDGSDRIAEVPALIRRLCDIVDELEEISPGATSPRTVILLAALVRAWLCT
jgi:hypothetical protein